MELENLKMFKYVQDNEWGTKYPNFKKSEFKCPCGKCNGYGKAPKIAPLAPADTETISPKP
mgnify:CR=1 FL=1